MLWYCVGSCPTCYITRHGATTPPIALFLVERATLFIRQRTSPLKATKKSTTKTASLAILREYGLPCIPDLWLGLIFHHFTYFPRCQTLGVFMGVNFCVCIYC